jgi:hypothetical protein
VLDTRILRWILEQDNPSWYGVALLHLQTDDLLRLVVWQRTVGEVAEAAADAIGQIEEQRRRNNGGPKVTMSGVSRTIRVGRSTLYRLAREGKLPQIVPYIHRHKDYEGRGRVGSSI